MPKIYRFDFQIGICDVFKWCLAMDFSQQEQSPIPGLKAAASIILNRGIVFLGCGCTGCQGGHACYSLSVLLGNSSPHALSVVNLKIIILFHNYKFYLAVIASRLAKVFPLLANHYF
jgi:hypothetical protein